MLAEEMRNVAAMLMRLPPCYDTSRAVAAVLESIALDAEQWERSAAPAQRPGVLPPDVVDLREWRAKR